MTKRLFALASLVWPLLARPAFARDPQAARATHSHGAAATSGHVHGASAKPAASKHPAPKTAGKPGHGHAPAADKKAPSKRHEHDRGGTHAH